jgi:hypothetical protein
MRVSNKILIFFILTGFVLFLIPQANASANSCIECHKTLTPFTEEQKRLKH